ncbi:cobaltochelatase subunit CobN [Alkalibacter mobilis]|uniref:cobaltochelatase subunit CobN n=1 Tax=Alkalibacter mobilis TaxID=2787712 RepID=UPI00189D6B35|nr:cobaltochelatase subunit CobN [Alkalibacter mobilis]MBF7095651.1 cobaltochelatase subunit CobN [Alkalibacter mobilis]
MLNLVVIMTSMEPFHLFKQAQRELEDQFPGFFNINLYNTTELDETNSKFESCLEETDRADFVFIKIHGSLSFFKKFLPYFDRIKNNKNIFLQTTIQEEINETFPKCRIMPEEFKTIYTYYKSGGYENVLNLVKWIGNRFAKIDIPFIEPAYSKWSGLYDPDKKIEDEESYLNNIINTEKPVVGILTNINISPKEVRVPQIDAIFHSVKENGGIPLCVYSDMLPDEDIGSEGVRVALERYMMRNGKPIVQSIINTAAFSLSILSEPGDGTKPKENSIFEFIGVPVLQAMSTMQSFEEWKDSVQGLDGLSLSWSVFQPEFDGQIITYPIATKELTDTETGPRKIVAPIEERANQVAKLAVNYGKLTKKPNKNKKIAIILHNNPPSNSTIGGAAGLDTPASVFDMITNLEDNGYFTSYSFTDGKDIIDRIIEGLTNDNRWSSPEQILKKSVDTVTKNQYNEWFDSFIPQVQQNLVKYWGDPVGDFMSVDNQLLIPGIINGNLFIGLQPPRAFEEKAEEMYHSTDIPCPHQYLGFYRWIERVFKADAIVHVGTHGTLEWLPGKEVGLSKDCFTDICMGTIPHLYAYIINAAGEGTQAKRRSYAGLVDHMIPSMVESGVYDELAEMDELMKQYYHVRASDSQKLPIIRSQILNLAIRMNMHLDLDLSTDQMEKDADECVKQMHSWVSNIQACEINDGLHIFGKVPDGDRFRNMLKALVRNRNGDIPSLRQGLCQIFGLDLEELLEHPEKATPDGKSNGILLGEVDAAGREIFMELDKASYDPTAINAILNRYKNNNDPSALRTCLEFVCTELKDKVLGISQEIDHFIKGINGKFVPPGQAGAPTRGNARILPTGKNFYTVDPGAMPSRSSWEIGKVLGNQLLERYIKDEGQYPESISMLVYATDSMRTYGDDIAETLYLLGVRPVWLGNTERVIGIETLSLEELGRPRIDVTLRITGLFRDAFPNLIERVEDAVNLVAALDEPEDKNYIKKHVHEEVAELLSQGIDLDLATEWSTLRIFGDAPGAYGAGVANVITSKRWNDVTDLGTVYTTWGCHAYGKKVHGEKLPQVFSMRMKKANLAVKNEPTREFDMLDGDDFFNYFGGMVAAITTHSGTQKRAYIPSSSDTDHIETLSLHEEASRVMRAKVCNPKWIDGLKKHGYRGASQVSGMVSFAFGWDATTDVIDDWMYDSIAEKYAFHKENSDWMREVNPWALHGIAENLLEASQRGMWNTTPENVEKLKQIYMEMEGNFEEME